MVGKGSLPVHKCKECGTNTTAKGDLCVPCREVGAPKAVQTALEEGRFEAPMLREWAQKQIAKGASKLIDAQGKLADVILDAALKLKKPDGTLIEKEPVWVKFCELAKLVMLERAAEKMTGVESEKDGQLKITLHLDAMRIDTRVTDADVEGMFEADPIDVEYEVKE